MNQEKHLFFVGGKGEGEGEIFKSNQIVEVFM